MTNASRISHLMLRDNVADDTTRLTLNTLKMQISVNRLSVVLSISSPIMNEVKLRANA